MLSHIGHVLRALSERLSEVTYLLGRAKGSGLRDGIRRCCGCELARMPTLSFGESQHVKRRFTKVFVAELGLISGFALLKSHSWPTLRGIKQINGVEIDVAGLHQCPK